MSFRAKVPGGVGQHGSDGMEAYCRQRNEDRKRSCRNKHPPTDVNVVGKILQPPDMCILRSMNGQYRKDIYPGLEVAIVLKKDQRSGKLTYGVVKDILTSAAFHSRGIKVRLEDGQIGRVAETDVVDPEGE